MADELLGCSLPARAADGGAGSGALQATPGSPAALEEEEEEEDDGDTRPWRCLDASHEAGCRRCTPPPLGNGAWVLRGGRPRVQSGEKQLRGALCRTPEWRSVEARKIAAEAMDASGAASTAAALLKRDCSALRKVDMLRLCRMWRYASNVWQPISWPPAEPEPRAAGAPPQRRRRLPRTAKATMAQVQAVAAPQPAPPAALGGAYFTQSNQVRCPILRMLVLNACRLTKADTAPRSCSQQLDSIAMFVTSTLAPAMAQFLARDATPSLFAAGAAEREAPTLVNARGAAALAPALARIATVFEADLARVQAAAAQLGGSSLSGLWPAATTAASPPLAETALHALLLLAHGRAAYFADVTSPVHGVAARHRRGLSGPERAQVGDATAADAALRRFLAAAAAFLARCREENAQSYLAASAEVLALAVGAARGAAASAAKRAAWARGRECSWPTPLVRYIAAASMPAAAAVAIAEAQTREAAESAAAAQAAAAAVDAAEDYAL